jgi:DNA segregation ATPase FtsK/SpoIIIE-like protein
MAGLAISLGIAIVGGALTGVVCRFVAPVEVEFSDKHWIRPTIGDTQKKKHKTVTRSAPAVQLRSMDHTQVAAMDDAVDDISQDEYELDFGDQIVADAVAKQHEQQPAAAAKKPVKSKPKAKAQPKKKKKEPEPEPESESEEEEEAEEEEEEESSEAVEEEEEEEESSE